MRYIKRIQPSNIKAEFLNDDVIEFDICNNIVDMSSLKIYYDAYVDPVYKCVNDTYLKRFMPRLSQSIIQELTVSVNNVPIQSIKEFNLLFNILNDGMKENDDIHSNKIDTIKYSYIDDNNEVVNATDFVNTTQSHVIEPIVYKYFIDKFIGFINDVKYLDCRNKNVKISIRLAPKWITYRGILIDLGAAATPVNTNYKYRIRNVYANIDILSPDEKRVPKDDKITYQDFKYMAGINGNDKNTYTTIKHTGSINYILSTFTDANRETDTGLQLAKCNEDTFNFGEQFIASYDMYSPSIDTAFAPFDNLVTDYDSLKGALDAKLSIAHTDISAMMYDLHIIYDHINNGTLVENMLSSEFIKTLKKEHSLDNSIYFKRNGLNIKNCQYRLNGQDITPLMSMMDIFNLAKEFFGDMKRVQSINSFQNEFFCFPMKVGELPEDMVSEIEWITNADNKNANGGTPIMFVCFDKVYQF